MYSKSQSHHTIPSLDFLPPVDVETLSEHDEVTLMHAILCANLPVLSVDEGSFI